MSETIIHIAKNFGIILLLFIAGMLAVYGFFLVKVSTLVIFPVFILGILIASLECDSGVWGAVLGICYLLFYDLLFTEPFYELKVLSKTDIVALVIF